MLTQLPVAQSDAMAAFSQVTEDIRTRVSLQNKAVELSILVTSGFATVAVAGIATKPEFLDLKTNQPWIWLLAAYAFIQMLILCNYIHQTFMILSTGNYLLQRAINYNQDAPLLKIIVECPTLYSLDPRQNPRHKALRILQPAPMYGTVVAAVTLAAFLLIRAPRAGRNDLLSFIVITLGVLLLICFLSHLSAFSKANQSEADPESLKTSNEQTESTT
ncbi:MAG TPA: hypothetical protein PKN33_16895 [Phycisphaerae bacterium]|nr:hypothetical protein [Phycisphaerae bacterium]